MDDKKKIIKDFELKVKENLDFYYDSETYEKIIKWYIDNHKFKLGLKAVDIALSQHNFSSDLLIQRANILIALQNFSDSLLSLERAYSLNPKDENIFILIGQVKIILGDSTGAIKILKKALEISDNGFVLVQGENKFTDKGSTLLANKEVRKLSLIHI